MKKFLLPFLLILTTLITFAQAPQGTNYQAVAYNNLGQSVANQSVGVRLSVLDGGANGTVLYQETQQPSTDNTGLFSIVLGNGTPVTGTFAAINWGNGTKWLKSEIDIAGGNNYVVMGSSQFMSVPYALYANEAGFASTAAFAKKASFSSGAFAMPDGFDNITNVVIPVNVDYVVPAGKNLYVPSSESIVVIDGDTITPMMMAAGAVPRSSVGAGENSIVRLLLADAVCFLADKKVEWKTVDVATAPFTVPAGKQFVVVNVSLGYLSGISPLTMACRTSVNGVKVRIVSNTVLQPGSVVTISDCSGSAGQLQSILNGYFMNAN